MLAELKPMYDNAKSFYGKADVLIMEGQMVLRSYDTEVAEITDGKAIVYGIYSPTTLRHIKEFLKQKGFKAESKAQIERDYMGGGNNA